MEVHQTTDYASYMELLEHAHFAIDSLPFGGYNTAIDAIFLGQPLLAYRGKRFYNRGAASLLCRIGLDELVADTTAAYVDTLARLIDDQDYRWRLTEKVRAADLKRLIFSPDDGSYFKQAVDYLIQHHDALRGDDAKTPIVIR